MDAARMKLKSGFTLIELMITVSIVAFMLLVAIPSFRAMLQNNRAAKLSNELSAAFRLARTEAVKRAASVSVCASANAAQTACGTNWNNGWIVFNDPDADGVIADSADRIKIHEAVFESGSITSANSRVTYNNLGFVTTGAGDFSIAPTGCTANNARTVNLAASGRSRVSPANCP